MRTRAERRHNSLKKMTRRLKEDQNQHSTDRYTCGKYFADEYIARGVPVNSKFHCPCFWDRRAQKRFMNNATCGCEQCRNPRRSKMSGSMKERLTIQERKALEAARSWEDWPGLTAEHLAVLDAAYIDGRRAADRDWEKQK